MPNNLIELSSYKQLKEFYGKVKQGIGEYMGLPEKEINHLDTNYVSLSASQKEKEKIDKTVYAVNENTTHHINRIKEILDIYQKRRDRLYDGFETEQIPDRIRDRSEVFSDLVYNSSEDVRETAENIFYNAMLDSFNYSKAEA